MITYEEYKETRKKYQTTAQHALQILKRKKKDFDFELESDERTGLYYGTFEHAGFEIRVDQQIDEYNGNSEFLGTFVNLPDDTTIPNKNAYKNSNAMPFFKPFTSFKSHYDSLRKRNYGRREAADLARACVIADYERALSYGDEWESTFITVKVKKDGVTYGKASLFGTESDSDESYIKEIVYDLLDEALTKAYQKIQQLIDSMPYVQLNFDQPKAKGKITLQRHQYGAVLEIDGREACLVDLSPMSESGKSFDHLEAPRIVIYGYDDKGDRDPSLGHVTFFADGPVISVINSPDVIKIYHGPDEIWYALKLQDDKDV